MPVMRIPFLRSFALLLAPLHPATAADKPNVLFIISDDLTAEALSCYGNANCKTPAIDALAASGLRFTRAYCQFPVCGPSRAALMSGMYPEAIGVTGNGSAEKFTAMLGDRPSMSQHFIRNGYYAARVSKIYHMRVPGDITAGVDGPDHAASWSERFNFKAPEWMTEGERYQLTNYKLNFDKDKHYNLGFGGAFYVVKGSSDGREQPDVRAADKAIEIMEQQKDGSFFLAVGLVRPHVPLVAPSEFYKPYPPENMILPEKHADDWNDIPKSGISMNSGGAGLEDPSTQRGVLSAYYASVAFMDAQVARIMAALDRLQLRERTIVVFTSDHGYHLGEHDFWQKMSLHEESTRIPLIVSVPGKQAGETASLAEQIDIYPTLAELAGLNVPEHCQGVSLASLVDKPTAKTRDSIYCIRGKAQLIRTEQFAFISYGEGGSELYDMEKDPKQITNLAEDPAHAEVTSEMKRLLEEKQKQISAARSR
ncbi:MAG: sulfatase [Verrucomicrobiae bacterium]|nr:sulfatase [Verrucomicrobiae bacterium]